MARSHVTSWTCRQCGCRGRVRYPAAGADAVHVGRLIRADHSARAPHCPLQLTGVELISAATETATEEDQCH